MNEKTKQEIKEYLEELSKVVDSYNPLKEYYLAATGFSIISICLIVIHQVGLLFGLILICVSGFPIINRLSDSKSSPSEKQLSERACIIMRACIERYKDPEREYYFIHYNIYESNLPLYKEFISIFPQMESKKLKKLSSIKLRG